MLLKGSKWKNAFFTSIANFNDNQYPSVVITIAELQFFRATC